MTEVILTCPICSKWRIDQPEGIELQQVADCLAKHMHYCVTGWTQPLVESTRAILRDAAGKVLAFDPDLATDLSDLAADYAGPWREPEALSPAYSHQRDAS